MTLTRTTAKNVRVTLGATIVSGCVQAIALVVLARLLTPADFGYYAGSLVIFSLIQRLAFSNLEASIVLQRDVYADTWPSMLWLAVLISLFAAGGLLVVFACLPVSSEFRHVVMAMCIGLPLFAIALVPRGKLRRDMAFGRLAAVDLVGQLIGLNGVTIGAAILGYGALSLAAGYVAQAILQALFAFMLTNFPRGGRAGVRWVKPVLGAAGQLFATSALEAVHGRVSPAFVGGVLGADALGIYSRADSLIQLPAQLLSTAMTKVLYTSFRVVADDVKRLRKGCKTLVEVASLLLLPLCCGMAASSSDLVAVLLGKQWTQAAALVPWIAVGASLATTAHLLAIMNEAVGRLGTKFVIQAITTVMMVVAFVIAVHYGLVACALAYGVGAGVFLVGQILLSSDVLEQDATTIASWLTPGLVAGACVYGAATLAHHLMPGASSPIRLGAEVASCMVSLFVTCRLAFPRLLAEMLRMAGLRRWDVAASTPVEASR